MRSTRGVQFYLARSAFKNIHQGGFFLFKAKPLLVNTFRGVPFNQCEHREPSRTSIYGEFVSLKPKAILVKL